MTKRLLDYCLSLCGPARLLASAKKLPFLGSMIAVALTLSIAGCGSGSGGDEPQPDPGPGGGDTVLPVTAPGLEVTANENFAGGGFVDIEKYNKAIDNYNNMGSALAGDG